MGVVIRLEGTDIDTQWLLTIFYIPYILFEWTALMYKIIPPRRQHSHTSLSGADSKDLLTLFQTSGLL